MLLRGLCLSFPCAVLVQFLLSKPISFYFQEVLSDEAHDESIIIELLEIKEEAQVSWVWQFCYILLRRSFGGWFSTV